MNMNDVISILMCVYNTPLTYLKNACDSILGQTYENIEFVIVDDASSDHGVIEYLGALNSKESKVRLFKNEVNLGLTKSLNVGLQNCNGKYIARMDSDDISVPERLEKQAEYLNEYEDVALVGSNIIVFGEEIDEKDTSDDENLFSDPEAYRIQSLFRHSGPAHPTFMFRSEFLHDNGIRYREDILKAQDYGIMADILRAGGTIRKLDEPLLRYRVHKGQITETSETEQKLYQCRVSYDYIRSVFPCLTDDECVAASLLGCSVAPNTLTDTVNRNEKLKKTCENIFSDPNIINKSGIYIGAVKKIIRYNDENSIYDRNKFRSQLRYMWWKKAIGMSKMLGRPWGMTVYTLLSYLYTI